MLRYHQKTLDLLGITPKFSDEAARLLHLFELDLHVTLPVAFKEWYSLANGVEILQEWTNDHPVPLFKLATEHNSYQDGPFLTFIIENQGVCSWGLKLDINRSGPAPTQIPLPLPDADAFHEKMRQQIENPPVYMRMNMERADWVKCADSLSEFLYSEISFYRNYILAHQREEN
ncbi:MAG: hypothetical protein U0694_03945 [Anaerolineae bacterium]